MSNVQRNTLRSKVPVAIFRQKEGGAYALRSPWKTRSIRCLQALQLGRAIVVGWSGEERPCGFRGRSCLLPTTGREDWAHRGCSRASPGCPSTAEPSRLCSLRLPTVREGLAPPLTPAQSRPRCSASRFLLSSGPASFTKAPPPSRRQAGLPFALWASATLAPQASAPFARARQPSLRQAPASLVPLVPASLALRPRPPSLSEPRLPSPAPASLALPAPAFPVHPGSDRCGRRRAAGTAGCCKARWAAGSVHARSAASGPGRSSAAAPSPASAACWRRRPTLWPGSGGRQAQARPRPEARPSGLVGQAASSVCVPAIGNDLARARILRAQPYSRLAFYSSLCLSCPHTGKVYSVHPKNPPV